MRRKLIVVSGLAFTMLAVGAACQNEAAPGSQSGSAAPKAAATGSSTAAAASGSPAAGAQGLDTRGDEAAEQMFALVEKVAALVDQSKTGAKVDCKKLGDGLGKLVQDEEAALKKLREGAGGKGAADQAMKKKYGEKAQTLLDKILEATDVDCNGEQSVRDAAKKLDL
jgi:hypothetical protein